MKKQFQTTLTWWQKILLIMGVLFVALIILVAIVIGYLMYAKPFGVDVTQLPQAWQASKEEGATSPYDHPSLTTEQEIFLEAVGVDVSQVSTTFTAEQEACAREELGDERVDAIIAGAAPTMSDYLRAGHCFEGQ